MVQAREILALSDAIAQKFSPEQILLFGSYASGQPTADSDVDLMVVMSHRGRSHEQAMRIRLATGVRFPLDLIVRAHRRFHRESAE